MVAVADNLDAADPVALLVNEPWRLEPHTHAEYISRGKWKAYAHLRYVSERVADAIVAGNGRLIVEMPPGHGKSSLLSKHVPIWLLDNLPETRLICASHGDELASHWGRMVRNEFDGNELLSTALSEDSSAADRWNTPQGGGMKATGIGGGITGWRGNVGLIDDPHPTWEKAMSPTHLAMVWDWFNGTFYDRIEPNGTIIILMHRWKEDDLVGRLIDEHAAQWDVIRLPALAEAGDPLGRAEGEALCPQRYDRDALLQMKVDVGQTVWDAKYQQNPQTIGGGRVYSHFIPSRNEDKTLRLVDRLPLHLSLDFNRNPGMHAIVGQYDPNADLFTAVHEVHGPYMKLQPCLDAFKLLIKKLAGGSFPWPELQVFGDPAGHQDRAETTQTAWQQVQNSLSPWMADFSKPMRMKVPRAQYPVLTRVDTFNEALTDERGDIHYKLHPVQCPRLLEDFKRLKADAMGLVDKSDEKLSHASEAEANRVCRLRPVRRMTQGVGKVGSVGTARRMRT
jgi:hypothetical protein